MSRYSAVGRVVEEREAWGRAKKRGYIRGRWVYAFKDSSAYIWQARLTSLVQWKFILTGDEEDIEACSGGRALIMRRPLVLEVELYHRLVLTVVPSKEGSWAKHLWIVVMYIF